MYPCRAGMPSGHDSERDLSRSSATFVAHSAALVAAKMINPLAGPKRHEAVTGWHLGQWRVATAYECVRFRYSKNLRSAARALCERM